MKELKDLKKEERQKGKGRLYSYSNQANLFIIHQRERALADSQGRTAKKIVNEIQWIKEVYNNRKRICRI